MDAATHPDLAPTNRNQLNPVSLTTYAIKSVEHAEHLAENLLASVTSYLHIRESAGLEDNDVFSCAATAPDAPAHVASSSTIYRLESGPENVQVSVPRLELLEGDLLTGDDATPIFCSALAVPRPSFVWRALATNQIVAYGPRLLFKNATHRTSENDLATRELAGNYSCEVSNKHGSSSALFALDVFCKSSLNEN